MPIRKLLFLAVLNVVCAAAVAWTVAWPAMWTDEVMFTDTSYSLASLGLWTTTAWDMPATDCNSCGLFVVASAVWQWLFGLSVFSGRMLNVVGTVALSAVLC